MSLPYTVIMSTVTSGSCLSGDVRFEVDWPGGIYFCDLSEARSLDGSDIEGLLRCCLTPTTASGSKDQLANRL